MASKIAHAITLNCSHPSNIDLTQKASVGAWYSTVLSILNGSPDLSNVDRATSFLKKRITNEKLKIHIPDLVKAIACSKHLPDTTQSLRMQLVKTAACVCSYIYPETIPQERQSYNIQDLVELFTFILDMVKEHFPQDSSFFELVKQYKEERRLAIFQNYITLFPDPHLALILAANFDLSAPSLAAALRPIIEKYSGNEPFAKAIIFKIREIETKQIGTEEKRFKHTNTLNWILNFLRSSFGCEKLLNEIADTITKILLYPETAMRDALTSIVKHLCNRSIYIKKYNELTCNMSFTYPATRIVSFTNFTRDRGRETNRSPCAAYQRRKRL